ncbi:MAG: hypothetical protein FWE09_02725 [Treponema sp.]|nr:hypothetical protein [Treponema sp.]
MDPPIKSARSREAGDGFGPIRQLIVSLGEGRAGALSGEVDYFSSSRHFKAMKENPDGASADVIFVLPNECRHVAESLFPPSGAPCPSAAASAGFAKALGIGAEYERLMSVGRDDEAMRKFLGHFRNNLDLLIQKTWVEKTDELRKEKLQDKLSPLVALIEQGDFPRAIGEFGTILSELAYLLFGDQSAGADFTEYTFRIDIEMGLFWWYGARIVAMAPGATTPESDEYCWALLLIGLCYLTNF